jgi:predicted component of type VI protein secretion system
MVCVHRPGAIAWKDLARSPLDLPARLSDLEFVTMDYQLVVVRGRSATKTIPLPGTLATVGRQEGCQLRIVSAQVSRRHCLLYEQGGQLMVKDLGSANGTIVNGKKIDEPQALAAGDVLTLGPVKLRVEKLGAAPTVAKAPSPAAAAPGTDDLTVVNEALGLAEPEEDADFEINLDADADAASAADAIPLEEPAAPAPTAQPAATKTAEPAADALSSAEGDDAVAEFLMGLNRQESDEKKR